MSEKKELEILKHAILLEKKGMAFYRMMASQTKEENLKKFFTLMAEEEKDHIDILSKQFQAYNKDETFVAVSLKEKKSVAPRVLSKDIKREISAAGSEAAAISAAMSFEKNAIELYSNRAQESGDANEKALYQELADWEKEHLAFLAEVDSVLREEIWNDNKFWPF